MAAGPKKVSDTSFPKAETQLQSRVRGVRHRRFGGTRLSRLVLVVDEPHDQGGEDRKRGRESLGRSLLEQGAPVELGADLPVLVGLPDDLRERCDLRAELRGERPVVGVRLGGRGRGGEGERGQEDGEPVRR
jgi:hypothetical protein